MSKDYKRTTILNHTVYSVRPGDSIPDGRKTFELFYDFLIILEIWNFP